MQRSYVWSLSALKISATAAFFAIGVFGFATQSHAVVRTWDGGGVTNNWSEDANWSSDTEPGASDVATFDATSTKAATIDANISVSGIDINTGYSGTITQAAGVTVTVSTGNFDISAGTFTGGDSTIDINGAFTVSGGTFTTTTGNLELAGNFTVSSGTFNESTGTIVADTNTGTFNVATTETFYNFTLNRSSASTISSGDTIIVTNVVTLTNGTLNTGTIDARGNISQASTYDGGNATIDFGDDGVAQTYTINGGTAPAIELDSAADASDSVTFAAAATVTLFNITSGFSGTVPISNAGDYALTFTTWTQAAGTYDASAQSSWTMSDFNSTGGTFTSPTTVTKNAGNQTWDFQTTQTFNNFIVNASGNTLTINTSDTMIVAGTLTLTDGLVNGASGAGVDARGNITQASTFDGGSVTIDFGDNGVAQTYTANGGITPVIEFDHASDANDSLTISAATTITGLTVSSTFSGTIPITNSGNNTLTVTAWTQAAGSYDASSHSAWNLCRFTLTGGTLTMPTTVTTYNCGNRTWDINTSQTFNNLTFNNFSDTLTLNTNDTYIVSGTLTLTDGGVNGGTGSSLDVRGNISEASTFDGGTAVIHFGDNAVAQTYTINGGTALQVTLDHASDANDSIIFAAAATLYGLTTTSGFSGAIPLSNSGNYTLTFNAWTQDAGTYDASSQTAWVICDFNRTAGSFTAPTTVTTNTCGNRTWDVPTTQTFTNLTFNPANDILTINTGDTLVATGTITLTDGALNANTLEAQGDVSIATTYDGGTTTLKFGGSATQTFTITGGTGLYNGDINIDKSGGQVNLASALVMDASGQDLTIVEGKLNLAGNNLTVNGTSSTFVVEDGGNLQLRGSETVTANTGYPTLSSGSTVTYTGDGDAGADTYTITTLDDVYHHLTINSTDGATDTFQLGAALDINGNLTVSAGTFDVTTSNYAVTLAGNWSNSGTFTARNGTVTLDADTAHTVSGATTWYNLTLLDSSNNTSSTAITFGSGQTQTITGTLTLDGLDDNDLLVVAASTPTSAATLDFTGSSSFSGNYLSVSDNTVSDNSSGISVPLSPANSVNGGNTTNWFANASIAVSAISGNTTEAGGTATFTVVLDAAPSANVVVDAASADSTEGTVTTGSSLTFTTANWSTPQTVTVTGADDDIDDGDTVYTITVSTNDASTADDNYDAVDPSDVSVTNTDNDAAGITVSAISGNTTEAGGAATFTVVLNTEPTGNVRIDSASSDSTEGTVTTGSSLTFTTANWDTPQTVTITGVDDDVDEGDVAYTIQTSTDDTATADATYDAIDPNDVSVTNADNDTAGVTVSAISGHTNEDGTTSTFTVVLNAEPTNNVEIDSVSSDSTEGSVTGGATLTFTTANWDTPQTVTVTGQNDELVDGDIAYSIQVTTDDTNSLDNAYDAIDPDDVSVTNDDDDTMGITVSAISGNTTEANGTATFTVVLDAQPTGNVQVDSVSLDSTEGAVTSGGTLTFTTVNWNSPQTVTVTGANDDLDDGDVSYTIEVTTNDAATADNNYDAVDPADVSVANIDNDTLGITVSAISGNTTEAGATATFTVVLNAQPTNNVEVDSVSSDSTEGTVTSGDTLTFTTANWDTPQTVTVTGVDDGVDDGDVGYTIQTTTDDANTLDDTYDAINPNDVSVTNTDNDTYGATLTQSGGATVVAEEGETSDDFTLVLTSQPSASVTVSLSYDSDITGSTSSLTFTTADWNTPQTVTVTAVDDDADETNTHPGVVSFAFSSVDSQYNNLAFSSFSVDVTDNDVSDIAVSSASGNTTEAGGTATFTVVLNTQPSADVSMNITSNDTTEGTVSTSSLTFTTGNWSTPQTVTITGQNDNIDDGDVLYTIVVGTITSDDILYSGLNPADVDLRNTDNDTAGITMTESSGSTQVDELGATSDTYTLVLTSQPTANVVITLTADASDIGLDTETVTFTSLNWNTPQTVTVTAVDDASDESSPHLSEITHAVASDDSTYNNFALAGLTVSILDNDTTSSGGSTIVNTYVTSASVEVTGIQTICEVSNVVNVILRARGAARVYLSNDPDFLTETMYEFTPDSTYSLEGIDGMSVPWVLAGNEGDQTVYAVFVSSTNNRLPIIPTLVSLGTCTPAVAEEEPVEEPREPTTPEPTGPAFTQGVSPYDGVTLETVDVLAEGEVFRGLHYNAVYVLDDGKRRPYFNEQTFYTWHDNFDEVRVVTDITLAAYPIGSPILPQPGKVLVKIESSPTVYVTEEPNILRSIETESDAEALLGPAWDLFVITLPSTIFKQYVVGTPFKVTIPWDIRYFFTRLGLQSHDGDRDGLTDDVEERLGTDPGDLDTDGDDLPDYYEVQHGSDPLSRN